MILTEIILTYNNSIISYRSTNGKGRLSKQLDERSGGPLSMQLRIQATSGLAEL